MNDPAVRRVAFVALALLAVVGALSSIQNLAVILGSGAVAIVAAGFIRFIRSTGWPVLIPAAIAAVAVAVLCSGRAANVGWFAICVLAGWCALRAGTAIGVAFTVGAIGLFAIEWATSNDDPGWSTWIFGTLFTTVTCLLARRQYVLLGELRQAQAGLADQARADERLRISRELHDVIAHSLTVSLLHVTSARLAVEEDPGEAAEALAEAERLGRQSLAEVRQAVGLLREGDAAGSVTPLPGVDQLPALINGFRRAGVEVSYQVLGDLSCFTAAAGLTVYRILQEALTNVARHSPGSAAVVRVEVSAADTVLTVDSAGTRVVTYADGFGLCSMRERAEALGGAVEAGPSATGWHVRAVLPSRPVRATAELG